MNEKPKRHWFQFGLRTMFVVVTVSACALGYVMWQWRIVQGRKAIIKELLQFPESRGSGMVAMGVLEDREADPKEAAFFETERFGYARISLIRRLLGDESLLEIELDPAPNPDFLVRIEDAFPEALILIGYPPKYTAVRYSLYAPATDRQPNIGTIFKTGLIEKAR